MTINELIKKPVEIVVENNITEDIVSSDSVASKLLEKAKDVKDALDFLVVYTDKDKKIKAVITSREISKLIDILSEKKKKLDDIKIQELDLERLFPARFVVNKEKATVGNVLDILRTDLTDTVVVQDNSEVYVGKVKRNQLRKRMQILLE